MHASFPPTSQFPPAHLSLGYSSAPDRTITKIPLISYTIHNQKRSDNQGMKVKVKTAIDSYY